MTNIARARSRSGIFSCKRCGALVDCTEYNPMSSITKEMESKHLCFHCAYWQGKVNNPNPNQYIINSKCYLFHPYTKSQDKTFYVMRNDGTVARSSNICFQGNVPEDFRSELPDTAKFITKQAYTKIQMHPYFRCTSKGCWDRYHCFWYDASIETNGPWNVIPPSHRIGGEYCESFLNKNNVYV